jgi:hypothetical protein
MKRPFLILAALSVIGCDDPPIPVPVEFEAGRWPEPPSVDTVMSVGLDGAQVEVEGRLWHYCEDFSAVAAQSIDNQRSVVTLYVKSEPATGACFDQSQIYRYNATIEVQHPVATGPIVWIIRVYHRGVRIPVPPWD